ncbi:geranyl transferase [Solemya velum gill symbiont]|uniref:(2E,6E)-farnesyl diphosphate synthase n=1 Tax=Solemya velum gill symbiont TaxID=2340 RepID=UPI000998E26A|nr:farnesyl diphosphate synthase [Solemya velum gill symbiont]OOZ81071.1 geranyl transferase [Solemya velum gill symbiont]
MSPELQTFISSCQVRVEKHMARMLPADDRNPVHLHQAMRYSALAGGKRIRPILTYATAALFDRPAEIVDTPAAVLELIHAYSLIHDDLPAMDDDDLRRGQPTCHVKFDEATAILAGDALQALAFGALAANIDGITPANRLGMIELLARSSGSLGMAGGQALDLEATGKELQLGELENIHIHKTGALIRTSVMFGALCADKIKKEEHKRLDHFAKCIGLAFQIVDDILDVVSDTSTLGKTQGKDALQLKTTYPDLLGLQGARDRVDELIEESIASLKIFDSNADMLREIAVYIASRSH